MTSLASSTAVFSLLPMPKRMPRSSALESAGGGAPDQVHLLPACLRYGYDDLIYAVLGDDLPEVRDHPKDRRAFYVPTDLGGRLADEAHHLRLRGRRAPDVSGERHAGLLRPHDGRPRPATDLPQGELVEHARVEPHGHELHISEHRTHQRQGGRNGVGVHDAKTVRPYREHGDKEPPGGYGRRAQHPHTLVDAGVAQDALVDPALVQQQHESQRREDRERQERAPEFRWHVAREPKEQGDRERFDDYQGVHEHRRPAPEGRRRPPHPDPRQHGDPFLERANRQARERRPPHPGQPHPAPPLYHLPRKASEA